MTMFDDAAALAALQAGDMSALAALFDTHSDRVYRLALGLLHDPAEAEDVVQETFLALLSHLNRFEGRSRLGTWLYRVAYNASMDRLRQRGNVALPADQPDQDDDSGPPLPRTLVAWQLTPEQILLDAESRAALDAAIQKLPTTLRTVFMLRDIEGCSTAETAEVLSISASAVKVRLHRARLILREQLAGYFGKHAIAESSTP